LVDKYEALKDFMYYGGLPLITTMVDHEQKATYLTNLFTETYIKDIINRNGIRNEAELEELLNILSSNIGSLTNPRKLSNSFKSVKNVSISEPTLKTYLEYLTDSFLIEKTIRYDIKGKKYIDTPAKYYFTDLGLRNARLNFRQLEDAHLLENVLYNELRVRGYSVDVGVVEINNKDKSKTFLEVDYICNKADKRIYIQSALSIPDQEKLNQEQRSLISINDSFKKIIITRDGSKTHFIDNGILIMNVYDFLLNDNGLDY
jgi:predicted AAA+ superfamily ATPase